LTQIRAGAAVDCVVADAVEDIVVTGAAPPDQGVR
jgi:hypothetical protein